MIPLPDLCLGVLEIGENSRCLSIEAVEAILSRLYEYVYNHWKRMSEPVNIELPSINLKPILSCQPKHCA